MAEDTKALEELVSFLSHARPELRKSASSMLVNLTATDQGLTQLLHLANGDVIQSLCRVVSDLRPIAEDAIKALINLTAAHPDACARALKFDLLNRVMTQLEDDDWRLKNLSMMLIANVTTTEDGAKALIGADVASTNALVAVRERKIRTLTAEFMTTEPEPDGVDKDTGEARWDDEFQYVAVILANITQLEQGRQFVLKLRKGRTLLEALLPQVRSPNVIRRRGMTALIKNLCFDTDSHFLLYDQLDVPSKLLYLLAGPEPLDEDEKVGMHPDVYRLGPKKKRELDRDVRLACIDALLLLCSSRNGRNDLRRKKVYPIIRNAHLVEPDDEIGDQIYKLVDFLIRDEEGEEPDWDEIRALSLGGDAESTIVKEEVEETKPTTKETPKPAASPAPEATKPKVVAPATPAVRTTSRGTTELLVDEELEDDDAAKVAKEIAALESSDEEEDDVDID